MSDAPTIRFAAPLYPGGRHCLLCGTVTVGAVFPPAGSRQAWEWRSWVSGKASHPHGAAKSELAAKNALLAEFKTFIQSAGLNVASNGGNHE